MFHVSWGKGKGVKQWNIATVGQFREIREGHCSQTMPIRREEEGKSRLPTLFCNTGLMQGSGWLNECNASNKISFFEAYVPLGLEALITDAG